MLSDLSLHWKDCTKWCSQYTVRRQLKSALSVLKAHKCNRNADREAHRQLFCDVSTIAPEDMLNHGYAMIHPNMVSPKLLERDVRKKFLPHAMLVHPNIARRHLDNVTWYGRKYSSQITQDMLDGSYGDSWREFIDSVYKNVGFTVPYGMTLAWCYQMYPRSLMSTERHLADDLLDYHREPATSIGFAFGRIMRLRWQFEI